MTRKNEQSNSQIKKTNLKLNNGQKKVTAITKKVSKNPLITYSMDELSDKTLGKIGTLERDQTEKRFKQEIEQELKTRELFGSLIKMARKSEGLTQDELAERLGVKKSMISKLENSQTSTKIETIINVLKTMNFKLFVRMAPEKENTKEKSSVHSKHTYELA